MSLLSPLCALDLGSHTTRIWFENTKKTIEIMTPSSLVESGRVIDDERLAPFLHSLFFRSEGTRFGIARPRIVASVPCGFTAVEKHALVRACMLAGASGTQLVSMALCAASGAGVDLNSSHAVLLLSAGHAYSELAVVVAGTQTHSFELRCTVLEYVRSLERRIKQDLHLSVSSAVLMKMIETQVHVYEDKKDVILPGKDIVSGKVSEVKIPYELIIDQTKVFFEQQSKDIQKALQKMDSSLASDILEQGILLYGGLSNLPGLSLFLSSLVRVPVSVVQDPQACVISGLQDIAASITFVEYDGDNEEYQVLGC